MPHLVVDISGHGLGHAGQVLPVVRALAARVQRLRVTLRTRVPRAHLVQLLDVPFATAPAPPDPTLVMKGPLDVDAEASAGPYLSLHDRWDEAVAAEADRLAALEPDLLLVNAPYVSLAAAALVGVPAVALGSLEWGGIYRQFCGSRPEAPRIARQIHEAYASARSFLQTTPHMPMPGLHNTVPVGPVARLGRRRRQEVRARLGLGAEGKIVLVTFGGIGGSGPPLELPRLPGITWVAAPLTESGRDDVRDANALGLPFADVLASADLVLTKTGYGTVAEAAVAGVRLLMVRRPDWPENEGLERWIVREGVGRGIDRSSLVAPHLDEVVRAGLAAPEPARVTPTGIDEAAREIGGYLA